MNKLLSLVVDEIFSLKQELFYGLLFLKLADRLVLIAASLMVLGLTLPWFSHGLVLETGFSAGFILHLFLAFWALRQVQNTFKAHLEGRSLMPLKLRRIALMYLIIGFLSIVFSLSALLHILAVAKAVLDIRCGFYLTTFSGLTILACGLERFHQQR